MITADRDIEFPLNEHSRSCLCDYMDRAKIGSNITATVTLWSGFFEVYQFSYQQRDLFPAFFIFMGFARCHSYKCCGSEYFSLLGSEFIDLLLKSADVGYGTGMILRRHDANRKPNTCDDGALLCAIGVVFPTKNTSHHFRKMT